MYNLSAVFFSLWVQSKTIIHTSAQITVDGNDHLNSHKVSQHYFLEFPKGNVTWPYQPVWQLSSPHIHPAHPVLIQLTSSMFILPDGLLGKSSSVLTFLIRFLAFYFCMTVLMGEIILQFLNIHRGNLGLFQWAL